MKWIKTIWYFLIAFIGMCIIGFFGLIGFIGIYGVFVSLWEYCPNIIIGLGLFVIGVLFVTIGWDIFCKFADKLKNS